MIEIFRKFASTWGARAFLFLLAISFIFLWGGQDGLRMIGLSKESTVAKVGNKTITNEELGREIGRVLLNIRLTTGQNLSQKDVQALGLDRQVLEQMIVGRLIQLEAEKLGISVSDDFVASIIYKQKLFLTPDGTFSKDLFLRFIHDLGFAREKDYVTYMKRDILRDRVLSALTGRVSVPEVALKPLETWNEQTRRAQAMLIDPTLIPVAKQPTENDLRDFYGKHRQAFFAPERRTFKALVFNSKGIPVDIKENDVKAFYEVEKDKKYKDVAVAQAHQQIREDLKKEALREKLSEKASAIEKDLDAGLKLDEMAQKHGFTLKAFTEAVVPADINDKPSFDQELIAFAFQNAENALSPLEASATGDFFMVYVEEVKAPSQLSFTDALDQVKKAYTQEQQATIAKERIADIQKGLAAGKDFKVLAAEKSFKIVPVRANRQKALAPTPVTLIPQSLNQLFSLSLGQVGLLPAQGPKGERYLLLTQLTGIDNPTTIGTSKEAASFKAALDQQLKGDLAEAYLEYLRSKYSVEINQKYFQ